MDVRNLYFAGGSGWIPIPDWARFLVGLGSSIATGSENGSRIVAAVALPTSAYAATLAGLGVISAKSGEEIVESDYQRHFESLCQLPAGTLVTIRRSEKKQKGIIIGCRDDDYDGIPRVGVQVRDRRQGGEENWLKPQESFRIDIQATDKAARHRPFGTYKLAVGSDFLRQSLPSTDTHRFVNQTRLDCLIVGRINRLQREMIHTSFAHRRPDNTFCEGRLQEIMRLKRFLKGHEAYRSEILPSSQRGMARYAKRVSPSVVLFDGATGFTRSRDHWRRSDWIVLLDRTEPRFSDAVAILNEQYIQYRSGEPRLKRLPAPPVGIELLLYGEVR